MDGRYVVENTETTGRVLDESVQHVVLETTIRRNTNTVSTAVVNIDVTSLKVERIMRMSLLKTEGWRDNINIPRQMYVS